MALRGESLAADGERLGHAEVGDDGDAVGEQHVVGLDVAVHHAPGVGVAQRGGDVAQHPDRLGHRKVAVAQQAGAQRFAVHVRHGEVGQAHRLAGGQEGNDVGMLELGGEVDLAAEPLDAHPGRQLGQQYLDDDPALERRLQRQEDAGHPAAAELALDPVGIAERALKLVPEIHGHGSNVARRGPPEPLPPATSSPSPPWAPRTSGPSPPIRPVG